MAELADDFRLSISKWDLTKKDGDGPENVKKRRFNELNNDFARALKKENK